jgi:methionyl-tRNA formyltransferase
MELTASPVKKAAATAGLHVLQPTSAKDDDLHATIRSLKPDVATVVAYGRILPVSLLEIPPLGFVNVHFSLLPEYRGAAPVQRALMDGRATTGVSIIVLTEGMDEGPVLATRRVDVTPEESAGGLGARLAVVGAELLAETLPGYADGAIVPVEQDHAAATYAPKISSDEARIDWSKPSASIADLARALDPEPGAWTTFRGNRIRIFALRPRPGGGALAPGELRAEGALLVGTGDVPAEVGALQPAGKRRMTGAEMARGARLASGERFG